tara:strand:- start:31 stop:534 length:504 start_codon:yes stop_codon:yes gene_type:complete
MDKKKEEYFKKGFEKLGETFEKSANVNELISNDNPNLKELEEKLREISILAKKEKRQDMKQILLAWFFIIFSSISMYASLFYSKSFYFLSVPIIIITLVFLLFIFVSGGTFGDAILKICKKLIFLHHNDLMDYVSGKKKTNMDTPIYTNIYRELQLKHKISQIKNPN